MANGVAPPRNGNGGIRVPVWAVSILLFMVAQVIGGIIVVATMKANAESFQKHMTDQMGEIKFRVSNIDDGVRQIQRENARFETKCEDYDRRFGRLEGYHGVTAP